MERNPDPLNFKTKQGSNYKKNVKKTVFQQCPSWQTAPTLPEDMTGATLSALRPETFKNTIKRIPGFATLNCGHYTGQAVRNRQPKTFSCLTKPSDDDISETPNGAKYWCKAECKEMVAEKITYTSNLRKMSPTVLRCCNKDLQGNVRNQDNFDYLKASSDTRGLLNAINQEGYRLRSAKYASGAYHQAQVKFYCLS